MVTKKKPILPMADPNGALRRAYIQLLGDKATVMRSVLLLDNKTRRGIADDLELLATIADKEPEAFMKCLAHIKNS